MGRGLSRQTQVGRPNVKEFSMGFRRRVRRRALVAGAVGGAALVHHERSRADQQQAYDEAPADDQAPADDGQDQAQYAPPPADPADEIEHLAQLHTSGALTDEEFTAAKARILGT
jgi:Short C-terminal domain